jgi:hypothetical protein
MPIASARMRRNWSPLAPDVILASGGSVVGPCGEATRTVPIVFTQVPARLLPGSGISRYNHSP